jgi:hypothetical protein
MLLKTPEKLDGFAAVVRGIDASVFVKDLAVLAENERPAGNGAGSLEDHHLAVDGGIGNKRWRNPVFRSTLAAATIRDRWGKPRPARARSSL